MFPAAKDEKNGKAFLSNLFSDTYHECKDIYQNDKPKFLELLTQHLDLSSLVPPTFYWSCYKVLGRNRKFSLLSMLAFMILQKILSIPTVSLLNLFLVLYTLSLSPVFSCHDLRRILRSFNIFEKDGLLIWLQSS